MTTTVDPNEAIQTTIVDETTRPDDERSGDVRPDDAPSEIGLEAPVAAEAPAAADGS